MGVLEGMTGFVCRYAEGGKPIYYLVAVPRDLILFGYTNDWFMYGMSVLLAIGAFFIFWLIFHLTEKRVSERI